MKPQEPTSEATNQARRRLIRGSFSVPAVLAVHNGSALAARSNQFRCVLKQIPSTGGTAPSLTDTTLDWVRVPRYRTGPQGNRRYWVSVGDLTSVATQSGLSYAGATGIQRSVNADGVPVTAFWLPWHASENPSAPNAGANLTSAGSVAVLFKTTASLDVPPVITVQVVGFVKENQTTALANQGASTRSCWTSIR